MTAYIFCPSGAIDKEKTKIFLEKKTDICIAADSGARTAFALGIVPDVIIGDLDSIDLSDKKIENIKTIKYPEQKNETDTLLAIKYALDLGNENIAIIGGLDGRVDHTLANLSYLKYIEKRGAFGYITDGYSKISYLENSVAKIYKNYKYISIMPLSPKICATLKGFKYPLENAEIKYEEPYTISNELGENAQFGEIRILQGSALICECDDHISPTHSRKV